MNEDKRHDQLFPLVSDERQFRQITLQDKIERERQLRELIDNAKVDLRRKRKI